MYIYVYFIYIPDPLAITKLMVNLRENQLQQTSFILLVIEFQLKSVKHCVIITYFLEILEEKHDECLI